jgi:hypothetical protein
MKAVGVVFRGASQGLPRSTVMEAGKAMTYHLASRSSFSGRRANLPLYDWLLGSVTVNTLREIF